MLLDATLREGGAKGTAWPFLRHRATVSGCLLQRAGKEPDGMAVGQPVGTEEGEHGSERGT